MSEWKRYKLSDLYEMSSGISSTKEQAGHGSPFLSFSVVFNNYFLPDSLIDLMDTTDGDKQKYSINEGDIFLTRTSETVDELAMSSVALKDYPEASFSGFLKRLRPVDKRIVYPKFMAFYLRSPLFRRTIINNTVMTLRASFNEAMFSYLEIMLPDFDTQKKIGDFLYSLEKKKQTNNQINQELETMASLHNLSVRYIQLQNISNKSRRHFRQTKNLLGHDVQGRRYMRVSLLHPCSFSIKNRGKIPLLL